MNKQLHIVSFDVPAPANYGGVIDVFYKLKSLNEAGVSVILHCFTYGREPSKQLEEFCEKVYYYKRSTGIQGISLLRPYIVNSRKNEQLLKNLLAIDAPILFEGLHTCFYLNHPLLSDRKKYVRAHNIEHEYYRYLAIAEKKWWRRMFFQFESDLLKRYEVVLKCADCIFTISEKDNQYFEQKYSSSLIHPFHQNFVIQCQSGKGEYILYQGNLSVAENIEAIDYLLYNVFSKVNYPVIIAGANPSKELIDQVSEFNNVELVANPLPEVMNKLIMNAHVHVLYSSAGSGMKLKLLNSLFQGRFVIANDAILISEKLKEVADLANTDIEFIISIKNKFDLEFSESMISRRVNLLTDEFDNASNAEKIISIIFD